MKLDIAFRVYGVSSIDDFYFFFNFVYPEKNIFKKDILSNVKSEMENFAFLQHLKEYHLRSAWWDVENCEGSIFFTTVTSSNYVYVIIFCFDIKKGDQREAKKKEETSLKFGREIFIVCLFYFRICISNGWKRQKWYVELKKKTVTPKKENVKNNYIKLKWKSKMVTLIKLKRKY